MKDTTFVIKIADLLHETGKSDQITFDHKFSAQLPNLTKEGISGKFKVQSLDSESLLGTLTDVTCAFDDLCDSCGTTYVRSVDVPVYTARFVFGDSISEKERDESEEAIFLIDMKSETINIEDMVAQAIILDEPFVKRCEPCEKRLSETPDEEESDSTFAAK